MEHTAQIAGFIAAHAIWSVAEGETLITILGSENADGQRSMTRLVTDRLEESVARGREQLTANQERAVRAALAFDGYITLPEGKTDAVILEARDYSSGEPQPFKITIPYRHAKSPGGFAVYRPKLMEFPQALAKPDTLINAFWSGVDSHTQAAEVWNAHIDQSR